MEALGKKEACLEKPYKTVSQRRSLQFPAKLPAQRRFLLRTLHHPRQLFLDLQQANFPRGVSCSFRLWLNVQFPVTCVHFPYVPDLLHQRGNPFRDVRIVHTEIIRAGAIVARWSFVPSERGHQGCIVSRLVRDSHSCYRAGRPDAVTTVRLASLTSAMYSR